MELSCLTMLLGNAPRLTKGSLLVKIDWRCGHTYCGSAKFCVWVSLIFGLVIWIRCVKPASFESGFCVSCAFYISTYWEETVDLSLHAKFCRSFANVIAPYRDTSIPCQGPTSKTQHTLMTNRAGLFNRIPLEIYSITSIHFKMAVARFGIFVLILVVPSASWCCHEAMNQ